jgi:hypothetical protein
MSEATTQTSVFVPMVHAVSHVDDMLGANRQWHPVNGQQGKFLVIFDKARKEIGIIPESELKYKVSDDYAVLNKFLADNGFSIQLRQFNKSKREFGVVSIMDIIMKWLKEGVVTVITTLSREQYPAFRLDEGVDFFSYKSHSEVIARIQTKTGDFVFITMSEPFSSFELTGRTQELSENLSLVRDYNRVVIPMVDLNHEVDISWLTGMNTEDREGDGWFIAQALQQTKLKMNQLGVRVKSAVAISLERCCAMPKEELVINRPFLMWIQRKGISIPLFSGWISADNWKDPGNLKDM